MTGASADATKPGSATAPVLPITGSGIELTDRACWVILAIAMAVSAAVLMYVSRGTTFTADELVWMYESPGLRAIDVLDPHNQSLIATNRILYKAVLETVGADYVVFRAIWIASALLAAGVLYALVKRRIGAVAALSPAVLMLFFGSAADYFTAAIGFIAMFSIAAGLGALLALERDDPRGDLIACILLIVSIATFSVGLGFLVGAAISVLLRRDRVSRSWIFLVPLLLFGAWWLSTLGASQSSAGVVKASNVLLVPSYIADSLAASLTAVTGLGYAFSPSAAEGGGWGYVLAALAVAALVTRVFRGNVPRALWVSLGLVLAVWIVGGLVADDLRPPDSPRYLYMGAIGVILVATAAVSGVRLGRTGLLVLLAATLVSLATNLALLRDGGLSERNGYALQARTGLAMLDLAGDDAAPDYVPPVAIFSLGPHRYEAGRYLAAAERYGSVGLPLAEIEGAGLVVRELADRGLAGAKEIELTRGSGGAAAGACREYEGAEAAAGIELPRGGATLLAGGRGAPTVRVGRFAPPSVELGRLGPHGSATLRIAPDSYRRPWLISVAGARSVEVCALS